MKIIDQFKDAKARLYDTIYRFPFTTIFLSAISLISIYFILASENDTNLLFAFVNKECEILQYVIFSS